MVARNKKPLGGVSEGFLTRHGERRNLLVFSQAGTILPQTGDPADKEPGSTATVQSASHESRGTEYGERLLTQEAGPAMKQERRIAATGEHEIATLPNPRCRYHPGTCRLRVTLHSLCQSLGSL